MITQAASFPVLCAVMSKALEIWLKNEISINPLLKLTQMKGPYSFNFICNFKTLQLLQKSGIKVSHNPRNLKFHAETSAQYVLVRMNQGAVFVEADLSPNPLCKFSSRRFWAQISLLGRSAAFLASPDTIMCVLSVKSSWCREKTHTSNSATMES